MTEAVLTYLATLAMGLVSGLGLLMLCVVAGANPDERILASLIAGIIMLPTFIFSVWTCAQVWKGDVD